MKTRRVAKSWILVSVVVSVLLLLAVGAAAQGPREREARAQEGLSLTNARVREIIAVQEDVTPRLMGRENIIGTAVGQDNDGEPSLLVFVNLEGRDIARTVREIPDAVGDVRVSVQVTEPFHAMAKPGGGGVSHTAKQAIPIQLGTSGGWAKDLANGYCCGGTLGSLIQVNGIQYILSNYHVFESDIVAGGNGTTAANGDSIIQPGLIDVRCNAGSAQTVATLRKLGSLPGNNVDASVAQVVSGMVRQDGAILEIGTLSSQTVAASINQAVKKSGRTTGLTRSKVSGLNATVSVAYDNECAGGAAFTKTFSGQIIISNNGSRFLNSGDSGSLMVEDIATNPKAVGLLFAGSSSLAVANPIDQVLSFVGGELGGTATMVGN